jgi:basic membrane protein A
VQNYYDNQFPGGQDLVFSADNNGVGLAMDTAKFDAFTPADYEAIFAKLVDKSVSIIRDVDDTGAQITLSSLSLTTVAISEIE